MNETTWRRITGWAAALVIILAVFYLIKELDWLINPVLSILAPFVIAFLLAYILNPLINRLEAKGASRGQAVLLVSLVFLLLFVLSIVFLVPVVAQQGVELAENLPDYVRSAGDALNNLLIRERTLLQRLNLPTTVEGFASRFSGEIRDVSAAALSAVSTFVIGIFGKALWLFLIPILTIYLLGDWNRIARKMERLMPEKHRSRAVELSQAIGNVFSAYIRGQIVLSILYGITTAFILGIFFRMNYSLILGLVAGLLSPIPYIGSFVIMISTGVVAYSQNPTPFYVGGVLLAMLIQNNIVFDNLVAPRILGKSVGLNLFWSIFALMLGGAMFGFIGVLLAYPAGAIINVLLCNLFPKLAEKDPDEIDKVPSQNWLQKLKLRFKRKESESDHESMEGEGIDRDVQDIQDG